MVLGPPAGLRGNLVARAQPEETSIAAQQVGPLAPAAQANSPSADTLPAAAAAPAHANPLAIPLQEPPLPPAPAAPPPSQGSTSWAEAPPPEQWTLETYRPPLDTRANVTAHQVFQPTVPSVPLPWAVPTSEKDGGA